MNAVILGKKGIQIREIPVPAPGPNQVLVRVYGAGLNRVDLLTFEAAGQVMAVGQETGLGREFSGIVEEVGEGVTGFMPGDAVMGSGSATLAEYTVTDQGLVTHVPEKGVSMEEAAVLPVALNTMHDALITHGRLEKGQYVLIQGAASGVGLMALQIAEYMGAGLVIGTSRTEHRREKLLNYGADISIDPRNSTWVDTVLEATAGRGVDLVIDQVGAPAANDNMRVSAVKGRIINVGRLGGKTGEFDFDLHAFKRLTYIGVTFRSRSLEEVCRVVSGRQADLGEAVAGGNLKLPLDSIFSLEKVEEALSYMAQNRHTGKILIKP